MRVTPCGWRDLGLELTGPRRDNFPFKRPATGPARLLRGFPRPEKAAPFSGAHPQLERRSDVGRINVRLSPGIL